MATDYDAPRKTDDDLSEDSAIVVGGFDRSARGRWQVAWKCTLQVKSARGRAPQLVSVEDALSQVAHHLAHVVFGRCGLVPAPVGVSHVLFAGFKVEALDQLLDGFDLREDGHLAQDLFGGEGRV